MIKMNAVVNPDESLAEMYHQRRKMAAELKAAISYDERAPIMQKLRDLHFRIENAESAMDTPGKQVRLF